MMTATSAATSTLTVHHAQVGELVAWSSRPGGPRSLLEEWARYKARQPILSTRVETIRPVVVRLEPPLSN